MKNIIKLPNDAGLISAALPVPNGTVAGAVIPLGADGLMAGTITKQATADDVAKCIAPQGLAAGEGSVYLLGIALTATLTVAAPGNQFAAVYRAGDGTYTTDDEAVGAAKIGYLMATIAGAADVEVAIIG